MKRKGLPLTFILVATYFIAIGCWSVRSIADDALEGHINLDLGALGLLIGIGLLRLNEFARIVARVWLVLQIVLLGVVGLLILWFSAEQVASGLPLMSLVIVWLGVMYAAYRELERPDIVELFAGNGEYEPIGTSNPRRYVDKDGTRSRKVIRTTAAAWKAQS